MLLINAFSKNVTGEGKFPVALNQYSIDNNLKMIRILASFCSFVFTGAPFCIYLLCGRGLVIDVNSMTNGWQCLELEPLRNVHCAYVFEASIWKRECLIATGSGPKTFDFFLFRVTSASKFWLRFVISPRLLAGPLMLLNFLFDGFAIFWDTKIFGRRKFFFGELLAKEIKFWALFGGWCYIFHYFSTIYGTVDHQWPNFQRK